MKSRKFRYRELLAVVALAVALETGDAATDGDSPALFRTLGLNYSSNDFFYVKDGEEIAVTITQDARSGFFLRPKGDDLELFQNTTLPDGSRKKTPVLRVSLKPGGELPLLIFSPPIEGRQAPAIEVLDDSIEEFPAGSYRVLNRLKAGVGIIAGQERGEVDANGQKVFSPRIAAPARTILFQAFVNTPQGPQMIFSNNWAFSELLRTLVIVAAPPDSHQELPVFRRIVEPADVLLSARPAPTPIDAQP
jgi:hypothetical protein